MLQPFQKQLVRDSFAKLEKDMASTGDMFYARLFQLAPQIRGLFNGDITVQASMFMQVISAAVKSLDSMESIAPALQAMGVRHKGYGVRDDYYSVSNAAMLWALEQKLGAEFTPELRTAWELVLVQVSSFMKDGGRQAKLVRGANG